MAACADHPGCIHHKHRRLDGALDQRSLGIYSASRGESATGCKWLDAAPVDRVFPSAELGSQNYVYSDVPQPRPNREVFAGPIGRVSDGEVPPDGEDWGGGNDSGGFKTT